MLMAVMQLQQQPIVVRGCTDQQKERGEREQPQNQWSDKIESTYLGANDKIDSILGWNKGRDAMS
jgi:hypothetical protein